MSDEKSVFKTLSEIDVKEHIDKKGQFSYLSWPWAVSEVMKRYPDMTYSVRKYDGGKLFTGEEKSGYMVSTEVTIQGITREMWLPIMDMRNKAVMKPTSTDVNKAVMRSLVKNLAMFGLGLYIYAGEDLPDVEPEPPKPITQENVNKISTMIKSIDELTGTDTTLAYVLKKYQIKSLSDLADNNAKLVLDFVVMLHEKAVEKVEQEKTNEPS